MAKKLKPEVSAKYDLVGVEPGRHIFAGLGEIDLEQMDLPLADKLHAVKFPHLQLKKKSLKSGSPDQS